MTNEEVSKKTDKLNSRNHIVNNVGAGLVSARKSKGITLIALVITIIVMLILVAVTVTVAINGGLFGMAKKAKADTEEEQAKENTLSTGRVKIDGTWYDSMEDYVNGTPSKNQSDDSTGGGSEMLSYEDTPKDETNGTLTKNALWEDEGGKAVIPKGFKVVNGIGGEQSIDSGLVIEDAEGNEFVWIPIDGDLVNPYENIVRYTPYSEPIELTYTYDESGAAYDSQDTLDYLYGKDEFNYKEDFKYEEEYAKMVEQVNKYHGFYIGRYETTIDGDKKIGSKYDTTILTADKIIKEGTNENNDEPYYYRWYGLYYASKNADVTGNGGVVQTAMIYGQLWDKTMDFIRAQRYDHKTSYYVDAYDPAWHKSSSVVNAGTTNYGDVALNIWDLESNGWEWTQEAEYTGYRALRGGYRNSSLEASHRGRMDPYLADDYVCSRLALYIKN